MVSGPKYSDIEIYLVLDKSETKFNNRSPKFPITNFFPGKTSETKFKQCDLFEIYRATKHENDFFL